MRIPTLPLIIPDSFGGAPEDAAAFGGRPPSSRLLREVTRLKAPPAALRVSTRAEPDESDGGPDLTSKEMFSFQRTQRSATHVSRALHNPDNSKERPWEGSEEVGEAKCGNIPPRCPDQQEAGGR